MESVKKMMVFNTRVMANIKESNTPQTLLVKVVSDLDTQMNEVLARTDLSAGEKVRCTTKSYSVTLFTMKS